MILDFTSAVVPGSLGINEGLKNKIGGYNLVLRGDLLAKASSDHCKIGDHLLGVLSLSGSRLSRDQHGVFLGVLQHFSVGSLGDVPEVRGQLVLVGVDDNHEETRHRYLV